MVRIFPFSVRVKEKGGPQKATNLDVFHAVEMLWNGYLYE